MKLLPSPRATTEHQTRAARAESRPSRGKTTLNNTRRGRERERDRKQTATGLLQTRSRQPGWVRPCSVRADVTQGPAVRWGWAAAGARGSSERQELQQVASSVRPLVASAGGSCGWTAIPWTPIQTACRRGAPSPSAAWHVPRRPACDQAQTKPLTSPSHIPARRSEHALKHVPLLSALQLVPMSQKTRARVPRLSEARLASPALRSSPTQAHTSFRAWAADLLTLVSFPQTAPHPVCMLHHLSTRFTLTPFRATASPWPVPWPRLRWPWVHLSPSGLTTWEHAVERARAPSPGVGAEAGRPGLQGCAWHRLPRRVCRSNGLSRMRGEGAA